MTLQMRYTWADKAVTAEVRIKRGTRLSVVLDKLASGKSSPWNKWTAPQQYFLVHKGTLCDNKRVIGDYSVDASVEFDLVFSEQDAEALVRAAKGKFDSYRPPHRDMLEDKLKKWEVQGAARRRSTSDSLYLLSPATPFATTFSGTPTTSPLLQSGTTAPRRASVVSLVMQGGSTVIAPTGVVSSPVQPSSTTTTTSPGVMGQQQAASSTARRSLTGTTGLAGTGSLSEASVPKTLERVKVVVEFTPYLTSTGAMSAAYTHEQVVTRGAKLDDVVHAVRSKSFASTYNDKCRLVYKGCEVEPRRSVGDYCAADKVMRCHVARDADQLEAIKRQTAEEGYRPPYEAALEERRRAREASAQEAAERMRAELPSPRGNRSNSTTVTITVTTVPLGTDQPAAPQQPQPQQAPPRRPSVGGALQPNSRRSSKGGSAQLMATGAGALSSPGGEGHDPATHLPPLPQASPAH